MAIKTYKVNAQVSKKVALPRTYSGCGHSWMGFVTITATQSTDSSMCGPNEKEQDKARNTALEKLVAAPKPKEAGGDVNRDVLCLRCGKFDAGAMKRVRFRTCVANTDLTDVYEIEGSPSSCLKEYWPTPSVSISPPREMASAETVADAVGNSFNQFLLQNARRQHLFD